MTTIGEHENGTESGPGHEPAERSTFHYRDLQRGRTPRSARALPSLLASALRLVWWSGRREMAGTLVVTVLQAGTSVVLLWVVSRMVITLRDVTSDRMAGDLSPYVWGFVAVLVVQGALQLLASELRYVQGELLARRAESLVARAASNAPLLDFERPSFHDRLQRALANSASRPLAVATSLTTLVANSVAIGVLTVTLVVIQPLVVLVIVVGAAPLMILTRRSTRMGYQFVLNETESDRRRGYFLYLLTQKDEAKEIRAYQLAPYLSARHQELWSQRIDRVRVFSRGRMMVGLVSRITNGVIVGGVLAVLIWTVSSGRTGLDAATAAAGAVVMLGQRLNGLMASSGTLYECSLFLADTQAFLDEYGDGVIDEEANEAVVDELADGDSASASVGAAEQVRARSGALEVSKITFAYPTGRSAAVMDVDLRVATGEMIALVGANGSGKTTMAKVLAGLIPPATGTVTWNGADVASMVDWQRDVAVVFQDYCRYMLTMGENIGFGLVDQLSDQVRIENAAELAGLAPLLDSLPDRVDTLLGPEFIGGTNLSGGQWQRIALARAFFRDAPVVILDEPSSALDPVAEERLFTTIRHLCRDRAVVVVSHRFSTTTTADRIYVLDGGRVIEHGSHSALMGLDGRYAAMFRMQALRYHGEALTTGE